MQDVPQTPPAETIDLASMTVENSYDGPHLQGQAAHDCDIPIPTNSTTLRILPAYGHVSRQNVLKEMNKG